MNPRASVDIDAPIERVWAVMLDTGAYAEWNPFVVHVECASPPKVCDPIKLHVRWANGQYHDEFYSNETIRGWYKDWISHVLTRVNPLTGVAYRDDPTVMAWELGNEPRCLSAGAYPRSPSCTTQTLVDGADVISRDIKSVAPKQLVDVGDEGFFCDDPAQEDWTRNCGEGVDTLAFTRLPAIDMLSFQTLGATALTLLAVGYLAGRYRETLGLPNRGSTVALAGGLTLMAALLFASIQVLLRVGADVSPLVIRDMVIVILLGMALALPVFALVRRLLRSALIEDQTRARRPVAPAPIEGR
jgi:hypothetical protein